MAIIEEAGDPEAIAKSLDKVTQLMETLGQALDALAEEVSFSAPDDVRQLLGLRASVVPYVDARLATCGELLAEGLRGEALGRATESPPLIETAKALDLGSHPNWPAWQEALRKQEMPEPVRPRVDLVNALEKAQGDLRRLKPLLDAWRRLNLANGGLAERITVLRRLRSADPANAEVKKVWGKALLEHEQQRLMQIEQEIKQATRDRDERHLETLVEEMAADWIEPVAPRLKKAAVAALESFRGSRIDRELEELATSLTAAHEARDLEAARELRRRWQPLADEKGAADPGDANLAAAAPAVAWVDRHDRMEALSGEIWQSLDGKPSGLRAWEEWVRSLDRMGGEMEDLAEKLPGEVDVEAIERARERIARKRGELERHKAFRRRMMYIAATSAAILLAAGVVYYDAVRRYEQEVLAACEQLDESLAACESGSIAKPPDLRPAVLRDIRVAGRMEKLQSCVTDQADRRERLAAALAEATQASEASEGEERGDPLAPWPAAFAEATKAVAGIGSLSLAKSPTERADLEKAKGAIDRLAKRWTAAADLELDRQIGAFDADLDKARGLLAGDVAGAAAIAAAVQAKLEELGARADTLAAADAELGYERQRIASAAAITRVSADGPLGRKLADLRRMVGERQRFASDLERLPAALGQWPAYRELLKTLATTFGELPQAREFAEAAEQLPQWEAIAAWEAFARGLGPLDRATPDEAKATVKAFEALPPAVRDLPMAKRFDQAVLPGLKSLADRKPEDVRGELNDWFGHLFMSQLQFVVTDANGLVYYSLGPAKPAIGQPFEYVDSFAGEWVTKKTKVNAATVRLSPQAQMAGLLADTLSKTNIANGLALDDMFLAFTQLTLDSHEYDPVPQLVAARRYIMFANQYSRPVREHGGDLMRAVFVRKPARDGQGEEEGIPGIASEDLVTFAPPGRDENVDYVVTRDRAKAINKEIARLLGPVKQAVDAERQVLQKPRGEMPELAGLISLAADGTPSPVWRGEPPSAGTLWWISSTGELMEAGSVAADGGFRLAEPPPPAGTPLWRLVAE